jgi:hypothetical protein
MLAGAYLHLKQLVDRSSRGEPTPTQQQIGKDLAPVGGTSLEENRSFGQLNTSL